MLSQYTRNARLMPTRQIEQRRTNTTNVNPRPPNHARSSFRSTSSSISNSRFGSASLGSTLRQQQNNAAAARLQVPRQNQQQQKQHHQQQQRHSFPAPNAELECDFGGMEMSQLTQESSAYSRTSGSAQSVGGMSGRRNHAAVSSHISVESRSGGLNRPISSFNSRLGSSLMSANSQFAAAAPSSQTHRTSSYRPAPTSVAAAAAHQHKPPNHTSSSSLRANSMTFLQPVPATRKLEASRWMAPIEKEMLAFGPRPPARRGRPVLTTNKPNNTSHHPLNTLQSQSSQSSFSSQPRLVSARIPATHRGGAATASQNLKNASAQSSGGSSRGGTIPAAATTSLKYSSSCSVGSSINPPPSLSLRQDSWEEGNSVAPNSSKTSAISVSSASVSNQRTTNTTTNCPTSSDDGIIRDAKEALVAELQELFAERKQQLVEVAAEQRASIDEQAAKHKASVSQELLRVKEQMNDEAKKQIAAVNKEGEKLKASFRSLEASTVESHDRRCKELDVKSNVVDAKIEKVSTILGAAEALVSKATQVASNLRENFVSTALPLIEKTVTTIVGKRRSAKETTVTPTTTETVESPSTTGSKKHVSKYKSKGRQHISPRKTTTVAKLSPSEKTFAKNAGSTGKSKSVSKKTHKSKHSRDQSPFKPLDVIDNLHSLNEVHSSSSSSSKKMSLASPRTHKSTVTPCKDEAAAYLHLSSATYSSPVITKKRKKSPNESNGDAANSVPHKPKRNSRSKKSRSTFATDRNKQQTSSWETDYDFLSQDFVC